MSKIQTVLAESLLNLPNNKKEEIGNNVVRLLGGDPTKKATGLPPRRGNSDGGIDGRIPIKIKLTNETKRNINNNSITYGTKYFEKIVDAAFCIKLESSNFNRVELGSFIQDMDREQIYDGIIVSVKPLSPDAKYEYERVNNSGKCILRHLLVEEILSGMIDLPFEFTTEKNLTEILFESLTAYCTTS